MEQIKIVPLTFHTENSAGEANAFTESRRLAIDTLSRSLSMFLIYNKLFICATHNAIFPLKIFLCSENIICSLSGLVFFSSNSQLLMYMVYPQKNHVPFLFMLCTVYVSKRVRKTGFSILYK